MHAQHRPITCPLPTGTFASKQAAPHPHLRLFCLPAGFYTYFASEAVSFGANPANWPELAAWARRHSRLFIPSVGPGYDDSRIRCGAC